MVKKERGKLIYKGLRGRYDDSIGTQFICFISTILFIAFIIIFYIYWVIYLQPPVINMLMVSTLLFFSITFLIFNLITKIGFEVDAIYENGITNRSSSLIDYIKDKSFQSFENISKIGYGKLRIPSDYWRLLQNKPKSTRLRSNVIVEFIAPFDKIINSQMIPPFANYGYKNDFYNILVETLKKKCPLGNWIELSIDSLEIK